MNTSHHNSTQTYYRDCTSKEHCLNADNLKLPKSGQDLLDLSYSKLEKDALAWKKMVHDKKFRPSYDMTTNYPFLNRHIVLAKTCCQQKINNEEFSDVCKPYFSTPIAKEKNVKGVKHDTPSGSK